MFKNYLLVAFRNLRKQKFYAFLNIAGLALGVTCCLLMGLYVLDELGYDRFHGKADQIYRINSDIKFGGTEQKLAVTSDPMGPTMVKDYPQVLASVRFREQGGVLVKKGEQYIKENRVIYADSSLFDVFTLPLVAGNPQKALAAPNSVVLTESMARKYFGNSVSQPAQALGQVLRFDNEQDYKVTGVMKDMPANSHFRFDFFLSMQSLAESRQNNWVSHNFNTYLLLRKDAHPQEVEARFEELIEKYMGPQVKQLMNINSISEFRKAGNNIRYSLIPLIRIHLHSDRVAELAPNGNVQYVYIFAAIALFILLIACINFMNLSTARSASRAKEVGVRKVMGSLRSNLIGQFLTESVVMSLIAFGLATAGAFLLLPYFNQLAVKEMTFPLFSSPWMLPLLLFFALVVGLLAGSYPAFFLSAFQPISVLKGNLSRGTKSGWLRSSLVVFQFATSVILIIGTIVIYYQLDYIRNTKLGFDKEQVLIVNDGSALGERVQAFRNEVLRLPEVINSTATGYLPVPSWRNDMPYFPEGVIQPEKAVSMQSWRVDHDYIRTLGMEMLKGRDFSREFATDSSAVIINETAAKVFGYTDPVGKKIWTYTDFNSGEKKMATYTVVGVVKNFHFESLRQNIGALCMVLGRNNGSVSFRLKTGDVSKVVGAIEAQWKKNAPGQPFSYTFLNEEFDAMYRSEQRVGQIAISFSVLAIVIACLGLFGLAAFTAEQRTKEIGIRKVLGADVGNIVAMLSRDFLKLVLISNLIAWPLAWWAMSRWLQDFAYRIDLSWWVFALAGLIALFIALFTISFQALKAALANPIKSLRTE
jgi:putative ABC transport system permease protein